MATTCDSVCNGTPNEAGRYLDSGVEGVCSFHLGFEQLSPFEEALYKALNKSIIELPALGVRSRGGTLEKIL
jgi:hypothetical protein